MNLNVLTLSKIGEFLINCKKLFASSSETNENTSDIN